MLQTQNKRHVVQHLRAQTCQVASILHINVNNNDDDYYDDENNNSRNCNNNYNVRNH